jgi:hypothetical protein
VGDVVSRHTTSYPARLASVLAFQLRVVVLVRTIATICAFLALMIHPDGSPAFWAAETL